MVVGMGQRVMSADVPVLLPWRGKYVKVYFGSTLSHVVYTRRHVLYYVLLYKNYEIAFLRITSGGVKQQPRGDVLDRRMSGEF
jgi:hypothetical protein